MPAWTGSGASLPGAGGRVPGAAQARRGLGARSRPTRSPTCSLPAPRAPPRACSRPPALAPDPRAPSRARSHLWLPAHALAPSPRAPPRARSHPTCSPTRSLLPHVLPHALAPGPRARSRPALGASGGRSGRLDSDGIKAVHRPGVEAGDAGEMTQEHWPQAEPFRASQPWAGHGAGHVLQAARAEGIEGQTPASDTRSPGQPRRGPRCSGADSPPPPRGTSSVSPRPTPGPRVLSTSSLPAPTRPTGPIREPHYSPQSRGTSRASQEPSCVRSPAGPHTPLHRDSAVGSRALSTRPPSSTAGPGA